MPVQNEDSEPGVRRATSRDVARAAGVSQSAVSFVLNGGAQRHGLSAATQSRVQSAAEALGYTPNHAARSLRRRRTNTITFMTTDLGNRYFAEVATAADDAARSRGYVVNIIAARTHDAEVEAIRRLCGGVSDGLVVHGGTPRLNEGLRRLLQCGLACVLLQDPGADGAIPCVRVDIAQGGRLATRHLLTLGHQRIAHITDRRMLGQSVNERLQGYREALEGSGIVFRPEFVIADDNSFAGGHAAMHALMTGPGPRPSAVFVFNDQMAIGGLHALAALGLRVPQDVAIVGFDGTELGAFSTPELTTIDHPRHELGRLAAEAVLDQLEGTGEVKGMRVLPVHLVVRRSCGGFLQQ
jgi:LacI family repressor for deo operon, udp, cdd, tsx, nupC, and nupG